MKLFGAQRIRETAKPLKFLELLKATFDCGGNTMQRSAGVRRHEINSLDPRKDDFLKLMMQSLSSFVRDAKTGLFVSYDLLRKETIKKARSSNIPRTHFNLYPTAVNPLPVQFKTLLHGQKGCVFSAGI